MSGRYFPAVHLEGGNHFFDLDGNPIDMMEWVRIVENGDTRIALTDIHVIVPEWRHLWVSTIWLGFDGNFGSKPPLLFETMIFGDVEEEFQWRWPTRQAALSAHYDIVTQIRRLLGFPPELRF